MNRLKLAQILCTYFPPLFAGYLRTLIYPFRRAIKHVIYYNRTSVTGSEFSGSTKYFQSYCFGVHGFYDWRNTLIAKAVHVNGVLSEIIEVGANIGTETIGFADIVANEGKVHAFEPFPFNINELEKIRRNNPQLKIHIYPVAIGETSAVVDFLIPPENYSGVGKIISKKDDSLGEVIKVEVHPLDLYIDHFNAVEAIFIDTEGHEPFVLSGARETIHKFQPVIVLEVSNVLLAANGETSSEIFSFFEAMQYDCFNIGRFFLTKIRRESVTKFHRHTNWVCLPKNSSGKIEKIKKLLYIHIFLPIIKI